MPGVRHDWGIPRAKRRTSERRLMLTANYELSTSNSTSTETLWFALH